MSIFELSVTGGVLILAVLLVRAVGRKRLPMRTFTVLWHVALLRLFLPVEFPSPISAASIGKKLIRSLAQTFSRVDSAGAADVPASPAFSGVSRGTFFYESGFSDAYPVTDAFSSPNVSTDNPRASRLTGALLSKAQLPIGTTRAFRESLNTSIFPSATRKGTPFVLSSKRNSIGLAKSRSSPNRSRHVSFVV